MLIIRESTNAKLHIFYRVCQQQTVHLNYSYQYYYYYLEGGLKKHRHGNLLMHCRMGLSKV